jgi:hypothetical protein
MKTQKTKEHPIDTMIKVFDLSQKILHSYEEGLRDGEIKGYSLALKEIEEWIINEENTYSIESNNRNVGIYANRLKQFIKSKQEK